MSTHRTPPGARAGRLAAALLLLASSAAAQQAPPPPGHGVVSRDGASPDWTTETFAAAHPDGPAPHAGGQAFTLTGAWPYGPNYAVTPGGPSLLHRGQGRVLETLALPAGGGEPELVSSLDLPGVIYDVAAAPPHLYVGVSAVGRPEDRGLFVVNVADPEEPAVVGSLTGFYCYGVVLEGPFAYLSTSSGAATSLRVVDVSDPAAPAPAGQLGLGGFSYGLAVGGGYAYVAGGSSGLHVVDVSAPAAPAFVRTVPVGGYVRRVDLGTVGGAPYAAVAVGSYASNSGFVALLDLSSPSAPALVGVGPTSTPVEDVAWSDALVYAAESYAGVAMYAASPTGLTPLDRDPASGANRVAAAPGQLLVADYYHGTHVFSLAVPSAPVHLVTRLGQSFAYDVVVDVADPTVGYVAAGTYGLVRLALDEPGRLVETGRVRGVVWDYSYAVAQTATHLYVADAYSGVHVVRKEGLVPVGEVDYVWYAERVYTADAGSMLFVLDDYFDAMMGYDTGLNPNDPVFRWSRSDLDAYDVVGVGEVAYVGTRNGALVHVLGGVSGTPTLFGPFPVAGSLVGLARDGGRLYAYGGPTDVTIFDLADPVAPQPVGVVSPVQGYAMAAASGVLYLATSALTAHDVTDPSNPVLAGAYAGFAASAAALAVRGDAVFVAARNAGVYRLASDLSVAGEPGAPPVGFALSVMPNPADGRATARYVLPEAGRVRLAVYDVLGRAVGRRVEDVRPAGTHEVVLDLSGLVPGHYFVRLETPGGALTGALTVAR